jgi:hypothetical protein
MAWGSLWETKGSVERARKADVATHLGGVVMHSPRLCFRLSAFVSGTVTAYAAV